MEGNIPIDIQLKKLADFLQTRRIVTKNWRDHITEVREKCKSAILDMPEHPEIKEILSASNLNYYNCKAILDVLMETEKDTKNVFGMYTSQRIADWRKIISLYEKDNCYLGEASQFLSQAIQYDIPSLRKQIAKLEKTVSEMDKLEENCRKKSVEMLASKKTDCKQIGIKGDHPKQEILELLKDLPSLYDSWIAKATPRLAKPMKSYAAVAANHRKTDFCLPVLSFLVTKGNKTAYEYVHGEAPLKVEEPMLFSLIEDVTITLDSVDLDPIDLDIDETPSDAAAVEEEIDWGDIIVEDTSSGNDIDWGDVDALDISSQIVIEDSGTAGGVASGDEAYLILDNRRLRNLVVDELYELASFCQMQSVELSQEKSFVLNDNINSSGEDQPETWMAANADIVELIENLTGPGPLFTLHMTKTSSTFVNRIVSEMEHKVTMAQRLEDKAEVVKSKRSEIISEASSVQDNCDRVLKKAKLLQTQIETDLSKKYNNRKVNILGGVQSLV